MEDKKHYVYMLLCSDNTLYTGYSTNPEKRLKVHNSGKGAKYTRARLPVKMVYVEEFEIKSDALRREAALKKLQRCEKLKLISEKQYIKSI